MYNSNCGHSLDLYVKTRCYAASPIASATMSGELMDKYTDITGDIYCEFEPLYCPICGVKIKEG